MSGGELVTQTFTVTAGDFAAAGEASAKIKRILKKLGIDSAIIRRVSIAAYEVEMNLVIHSLGGQMEITVYLSEVVLVVTDVGPGIPDIDLAMSAGYSTASEDIRMMGFGAGMGLPNMAKNADWFDIKSKVGEGTTIKMVFK